MDSLSDVHSTPGTIREQMQVPIRREVTMRLDKNAIGDLKEKSKIDCTDVESMYSQQIGTFKNRSKSQFQKAEQRLVRKQQ